MSVAQKLNKILEEIPDTVTLIAVSKNHGADKILEAYQVGHRVFGENRVKELCEKQEILPKDIQWHMIGHLQTNKVKYIVPFVYMIHAVDSEKLLLEIDKQAAKAGRVIKCLVQIHIAREETKFGFTPDEAAKLFTDDRFKSYTHIEFAGLMAMASLTDNTEQIQSEFHQVAELYNQIKSNTDIRFSVLSIGMSGDYPIAIHEGATHIRVGSAIFGDRT
jgi:pyridoxal phosphate enzyme (YggS family)